MSVKSALWGVIINRLKLSWHTYFSFDLKTKISRLYSSIVAVTVVFSMMMMIVTWLLCLRTFYIGAIIFSIALIVAWMLRYWNLYNNFPATLFTNCKRSCLELLFWLTFHILLDILCNQTQLELEARCIPSHYTNK